MRKLSAFLSLLIILLLIYYSFYSLMPSEGEDATIPDTGFSSERALIPLKEISKAPHYVGSEEHERVRQYLIGQLEALGLQVEEQTGYVLQEGERSLDKPKNILARLKGSSSGKALLLLTHYDSAKVPSPGASDAGSGVVTILETLRAYLASGKTPVNDIIVLFSDAEEIGLDGARLFVNEHPWAKEIGLALNFEARGSGGPGNMILETNQGNANLIRAFIEANPDYPVASSLMYSVYKMLPNDTDSTVFREDGDIDSYFFAFIDDHYDYHTANDTYENLDRNTLQHQGSYLLPLLHYFADADLSNLKSDEDYVYVNFPFVKMISYPFSWILWMLLIAIVLFILLIGYGLHKGRLKGSSIGRGFIAFLLPLLTCGAIGYGGWLLLLVLYPQYKEMQDVFTYNGHFYIAFFVLLTLAILFRNYRRFKSKDQVASFFVAPLAFWLLINIAVFVILKGAAYFIIPVYFGLLSFWLLIRQEKPNLLLLTLLSIPAIFFFAPLVQFFPVGLGLKMLVISCIFTVLIFGLLLPVFGAYRWKNLLSLGCFLLAAVYFITAHFRSDFSEDRQKPNSLVYYSDADTGNAYWVTYDQLLDPWTRGYLGDAPETASKYIANAAGSKYNTNYSYASEAPLKNIPLFKTILNADSLVGHERSVSITIIPQRKVHQVFLYADTSHVFKAIAFNGKKATPDSRGNVFANRPTNGLLRYYVTDGDSLEISYTTTQREPIRFTVLEYSYDLLEHPLFTMNKRSAAMMPKPFVVTDAIVIKKSFSVDSLPKTEEETPDLLPDE